jgi:hypothetical protein
MQFFYRKRFILVLLMIGSFSLTGFSQQTPINPIKYFSERSKSVVSHDYFIKSNTASVISYFKNLGLIKYSKDNFDASTIRFKNSAQNIFVMVFRTRIPKDKIYIIMSREEYVDEIDESITIMPIN